jgi:hypothetical protein
MKKIKNKILTIGCKHEFERLGINHTRNIEMLTCVKCKKRKDIVR